MNTPILYIKNGCPWCDEALSYFRANNIRLETREVRSNKVFMEQMVKVSGQTKTPTFVLGDFIVADFDIGEFKVALQQAPAIQAQLGLWRLRIRPLLRTCKFLAKLKATQLIESHSSHLFIKKRRLLRDDVFYKQQTNKYRYIEIDGPVAWTFKLFFSFFECIA